MLSCSRRHMRTLLNMMEERGWLTWEAEAGRGKRSKLAFLYTGLALQQQRAEDLLEQDRIDQLVQLVGDKAAVRQMLVSHLGRSFRQGRHILRVLYYRPMKNLLPGSALRRSENHIARQIFSALTRVNEGKRGTGSRYCPPLAAAIGHPLALFFCVPASTFTTDASWKWRT
ncbi:HTH-type transcriptional regulator sgrR [Raoultella terrigena]|uniref:HTH-type transcriptional regulator sgrR n=1 Tax=Raoultella terrigena TaxID=577 RepID=A0A4U9D648_RAOTE|nr:HTH-type transcriptional regulator sgrR [Raoultella terrigena]